MTALRILGNGFKDVYNSFLYAIIVALLFWVCCIPSIVLFTTAGMNQLLAPVFFISLLFVPPALIVLFAAMDPRRIVDRMDWIEAAHLYRSSVFRSWRITFVTILPLVILAWNVFYFAGSGYSLEILVPLWIVMWFFFLIITVSSFSLAGTQQSDWRNAFRGSMFVLVKYPGRSVLMGIILILLGWLLVVTVIPMLALGPAVLAAITNRFVFAAFDVEVFDPEAPTTERVSEVARGAGSEPSIWGRMFHRSERK